MDCVSVGKFISELRKEKSLTQKQLAEKLGVTDKAVSRWETGKGYPDIETLLSLSEVLDVSLNELLSAKRLEKEKIEIAAEENLTVAYKDVRVLTKKNKTKTVIAIMLLFASIVSVITAAVSIAKLTKKSDYYYRIEDTGEVLIYSELSDKIYSSTYISEKCVCTDFEVYVNRKNQFVSADMSFDDPIAHKRINLKALNMNGYITCHINVLNEYMENEDGITFEKTWDFLENSNCVNLAEKYCAYDFEKVCIDHLNTTYWYFDEKAKISFGSRQHLYQNGEIRNVRSSKGMDGKYFEAGITAIPFLPSENDKSLCTVYIR